MAVHDKIEKTIILRAPRARVWRAIANAAEFGAWFGARFDGPFVAGAESRGMIVPTTVDPEVAKMQKPYQGLPINVTVDRIEPEQLFSFRWHPYDVEPAANRSTEPQTLVTFRLDEVSTGVRLTITESGFDQLPATRREKAFAANEGGWEKQTHLIEKYLVMQSAEA
jgi:uncharacterized protein YndB with AHSA1/START domain